MRSRINSNKRIIFNGEVYNKGELEALLPKGFSCKTSSDTEVLLECFSSENFTSVLESIRGMFAFALLDTESEVLLLARDRFGEKPLHYWNDENNLFFSSQYDTTVMTMKIMGIPIEFDQKAIYRYLILGYFSHQDSLVHGIRKIAPGSFIEFKFSNHHNLAATQKKWFDPWRAKMTEDLDPYTFRQTIYSAVKEQLIGDVPVGVFLSGGADSTLVSAIAQKFDSKPIHSFSLGFENPEFDESRFARLAAEQIGTEHHAVTMTSTNAKEILPSVLRAYSEPLGDPSVFPTTFISQKAREFVTVALTGDGADELFYGYGRYNRFAELAEINKWVPSRYLQAKLLNTLSILPQLKEDHRIKRLKANLVYGSPGATYASLVGFGHYAASLDTLAFGKEKLELYENLWELGHSDNHYNRLREIDIASYLCDDILVKVDRAAMAFSLETRAPFLDVRIQELAARAPLNWLKTHENKAVIKSLLEEFVNSRVYRRPKMGFGAPLGEWFSSSLKSWTTDIVFETSWSNIGIDDTAVKNIFDRVIQGNHQDSTFLWVLLSLGASIDNLKSCKS
jgi:asparagine synthase (glutamine-hydrolysing)